MYMIKEQNTILGYNPFLGGVKREMTYLKGSGTMQSCGQMKAVKSSENKNRHFE